MSRPAGVTKAPHTAAMMQGRDQKTGLTDRPLIAKFYRDTAGSEPVDAFIQNQEPAVRLAIDRQLTGSTPSTTLIRI